MIHEDFAFKFARKKIMHRIYLRSFFDEASNFSSKECSSPSFRLLSTVETLQFSGERPI